MKRRTLDVLFSTGGALLAILLLVAGIVLNSNATFARNYVHDQLLEQHITFPTVANMKPEEKQQACLVKYAGQKMSTGDQAECYANHYIALHLESIANGMTYADAGKPQTQLKNEVAAAQKTNAPNLADLQQQLNTITTERNTLFQGETLRGLLLTSYGFSIFGQKAAQAAIVAFFAAGLLLLLAIAGFIHAFVIPKNKAFAPVGTE